MGASSEPLQTSKRGGRRFRIIGTVALGLWAVSLVGGLGWLWAYDSAPGRHGQAPSRWPDNTSVQRISAKFNLLAFVHPHCPCSRATVNELARLMAQAGDRISGRVIFMLPSDFAEGWARSDLYESAAGIPGVMVSIDTNGAEARRFAAASSGQVLLYNPKGNLVFAGGITASRGHEGDNDGESAILALASNEHSSVTQTPVYGCQLFSDPTSPLGERELRCPK
jgi:hypothetical protein